jgi:hypothetical protein
MAQKLQRVGTSELYILYILMVGTIIINQGTACMATEGTLRNNEKQDFPPGDFPWLLELN